MWNLDISLTCHGQAEGELLLEDPHRVGGGHGLVHVLRQNILAHVLEAHLLVRLGKQDGSVRCVNVYLMNCLGIFSLAQLRHTSSSAWARVDVGYQVCDFVRFVYAFHQNILAHVLEAHLLVRLCVYAKGWGVGVLLAYALVTCSA